MPPTARYAFGSAASPSRFPGQVTTAPGNVVFRDGLPAALIDFDLAKPTTRLYDIANAL